MHHPRLDASMGHLPPQPTVFVGREDEIAGAMEMLTDSHCRLLTLAGQGGIGKTRLALEIAARLLDYYPDGVHFVDLQAVYTADALIQVIADTLGCALSGHQPAFDQVLHFLRERDILLLLDNFEQLLPEQAEVLVGDLLNGCPKLTVLVTSREVLNVRQEWVWRVNGLAYPQEQPGDAVEDYDAIQLFVERARHIRHDFQLEADLPHILEICRLVEGMPLALELAAGWLKVLSCQAIAEEIRHNLDFLNSHQRDLPERHRSMRAVFEQGWKLLSPAERETMNRLSIFKGGFRREAAEQAAGANLATLLLLADKSLLRVDAGGRFHIHELVRQYAAEQLSDAAAALLDAHCAHYAEFLHQRERDLSGGRQSEACSEIAEELDNIRAAWSHALNRDKFQTLLRMTTPYSLFCQFRGRYQEAHKTYHSATTYLARLEGIPDVDRALGTLLAGLGWMKIRLGQLNNAEIIFQQSEAAFRRLGVAPTGGYAMDPLIGQAVVALVRGEHGAAQHLAEQASQQADQSNSSASLRIACRTLAEAHLRQGNHERAHQYALRAYQLCEQADDRWFMAYCLTTLGEISIEVREYATARQHFERAYILRQEIHDPEGMALILAYLGDLALLQQAYGEALRCYHESRALYEQQVSDPGGLAKALAGLSRAYLSLGDYQAASETCRRGLQLAVSIEYIPVLLQLFNVAGELCYGAQRHEAGLEILALVAHHAMTNHASRSAVQHFLAQRRIAEPPPPTGHDLEHASALLQMAASAERYLLEIEQTQWLKIEGDGATGRDTNQALPDPLSQRELEVLGYIAAGLQNREIADRLFVSLNTVKTHINNIYSKLDVSNRVQAVARAQELELL